MTAECYPLLDKLTIRERLGKMTFRYWQEGPGDDRNFSGEQATLSAIDYIHLNPIRKGFVEKGGDWKWSSARWYASDGQIVDPDLPLIHGLPWRFFTSGEITGDASATLGTGRQAASGTSAVTE